MNKTQTFDLILTLAFLGVCIFAMFKSFSWAWVAMGFIAVIGLFWMLKDLINRY